MARKKSTPHRSPSFLGDVDRDIPRTLALSATTPALQAQLLRDSAPHEMPIPTDWLSERIKALKPNHQYDLALAHRIISKKLRNRPVSDARLQWATEIGLREQQLEYEEENGTISADSEGNVGERRTGTPNRYTY